MATAIISLQGKQFYVSEGDTILLDKPLDDSQQEIIPLYRLRDGKLDPEQGKIALTLLGPAKGPKIVVFKYKAKPRPKPIFFISDI